MNRNYIHKYMHMILCSESIRLNKGAAVVSCGLSAVATLLGTNHIFYYKNSWFHKF